MDHYIADPRQITPLSFVSGINLQTGHLVYGVLTKFDDASDTAVVIETVARWEFHFSLGSLHEVDEEEYLNRFDDPDQRDRESRRVLAAKEAAAAVIYNNSLSLGLFVRGWYSDRLVEGFLIEKGKRLRVLQPGSLERFTVSATYRLEPRPQPVYGHQAFTYELARHHACELLGDQLVGATVLDIKGRGEPGKVTAVKPYTLGITRFDLTTFELQFGRVEVVNNEDERVKKYAEQLAQLEAHLSRTPMEV